MLMPAPRMCRIFRLAQREQLLVPKSNAAFEARLRRQQAQRSPSPSPIYRNPTPHQSQHLAGSNMEADIADRDEVPLGGGEFNSEVADLE